MIIINIIGGLGNQMFQYAFGYALSQSKKNVILKLDINSFEMYNLRDYELHIFNINTLFASKEEVKKLKYKKENLFEKIKRKSRKKSLAFATTYYKEQYFNFDKNVFNAENNTYFEGYWQSEKYFKKYRKELLRQFTLKKEIHFQSQRYEQDIKATMSVSLHIRRGDYVTNAHTNSVHGTCSLEYYKSAVLKIEKEVENAQFFVFSDDLAWAKQNIDFIDNIVFVELDEIVPDREEMYLMSQCKHNIIANSSFSWWGAWLNQNQNKIVITPKHWFNDTSLDTSDLIPKTWIRL